MILAVVERALAPLGVERRGESRVVVACSGGADSVVLAHAVAELLGARRVILGHVDHAVRAGSSDDAAFVAELARRLGAESVTTRLEPGPDDEARLRELRYAALEAQRDAAGARLILTAHTADDQAETILLGIIRSAHPTVLDGIPRVRGVIARPLLDAPRAAVRAYAHAHGLSWREDPTNVEPRFLRNRIRKELLPLIESRYRPGFAARLAQLPDALARARTDVPAAGERPSNTPAPPAVVSPVPESPDITIERRAWTGAPLPRDARTAVFDAEQLDRVVVRAIRPGDRIRPLGLNGSRKLQDVLVDAKVPREMRPRLWVAAHPSGEVVWVPGLARAEVAPVHASTTQVWILTCGAYADPSL